MTTDTTALQERIARALYENAEYYGPAPTQPPWEWRDDEERGEALDLAAAVLPIIAAEVQAASEKAWDEGHNTRRTVEKGGWYLTPYRATETGDQA